MNQISRTVGWEISGGIKATAGAQQGGKECEKGCVTGEAEASLAAKYSDTQTTMSGSNQTTSQMITETINNTVSGVGKEYVIVAWALVDKFELKDFSGRVVQAWENVNRLNRVHQWYPADIGSPVAPR